MMTASYKKPCHVRLICDIRHHNASGALGVNCRWAGSSLC